MAFLPSSLMSAYRPRKAANRGSGDFGRFPFLDNSSDRKLLGRLPSVQCKMSAPGQKRKCWRFEIMSALTHKADIAGGWFDVRFVPPIAELAFDRFFSRNMPHSG
jgi:hypothetical protein